MSVPQSFSEQLAGFDGGIDNLGLFRYIRNNVIRDINPFPMDHPGYAHLAGFAMPAAIAGCSALAGKSLTFTIKVMGISETAMQQHGGCGSQCSSGECDCGHSGCC
jgi:hypothetical protein